MWGGLPGPLPTPSSDLFIPAKSRTWGSGAGVGTRPTLQARRRADRGDVAVGGALGNRVFARRNRTL